MSTDSSISNHISSLEWSIETCVNQMLKLEGELKAYKHALWSAEYLLSQEEEASRQAKAKKKEKANKIGPQVVQARKDKIAQDIVAGHHEFGDPAWP